MKKLVSDTCRIIHSGTDQKCWEEQEKNSEINRLDFKLELANYKGKIEKKNINK
jgi:hypothetical protein